MAGSGLVRPVQLKVRARPVRGELSRDKPGGPPTLRGVSTAFRAGNERKRSRRHLQPSAASLCEGYGFQGFKNLQWPVLQFAIVPDT